MRIGAEVYHALRGIIIERYGALSASVGDEGGFAPDLADVAEALELIMAAIKATGHQDVVRIALDVAASELAVRFAALCLELVTPTCHTNSSHQLVTTSSLLCRRVCFCVPQLHRVFGHRGGGGNIKGLWCIKIKGLWCIAHILWLCV
jgi:enolase